MAKPRTLHVCQSCGHESPKWLGKCPGCGGWNTFVEEVREKSSSSSSSSSSKKKSGRAGWGVRSNDGPIRLADVAEDRTRRIVSGMGELDRVLGGGFVAGGVVMLGGDPGIGKSTLSLQIAGHFANAGQKVLYVSGEESLGQIRMRATRLGVDAGELWVVLETSLERTEAMLEKERPDLVVFDSIQTLATERLTSSPGSVAQLREVTGSLTQRAKGFGIPTILIGHVTKDGAIAGPKILEHMVDTVLYFEAQSGSNYRILRAVKNRFGSTNEIGVFEMRSDGLAEVENPSAVFLDGRAADASGSVVVPVLEGTRPLLVEIQALVSPTAYGPPRINAVGVESSRVMMVLNVLEKRSMLSVAGMDVFVNVAGGVRVSEPAADLGIAAAIASSFLDRAVSADLIVFGELGLTGELRAVAQALPRLQEAEKLGFSGAVLPTANASETEETQTDVRRLPVGTVTEVLETLFE
jgi:DNA repair protein RadA/Sms